MELKSVSAQFRDSFTRLINSDFFKAAKKKCGLNDYKFCILTGKYRDGTINLLSNQFSYLGGGTLATSLNVPPEHIDLTQYVDHAIKTGLSSVILDKNNKVCYVALIEDSTDEVEPTQEEKKQLETLPGLNVWLMTIDQLLEDSEWYQKHIVNNKKNKAKKGQYIHSFMGATRKDLTNKNIFSFRMAIACAVYVDMKCVKYQYAECVHPATVHNAKKKMNFFNNVLNAYDDEKWSEIPSRLNVYNYFKDKFENDDMFRNKLNKSEVLKNLNKNAEIVTVYTNWEKVRQYYTMKQMFQKWIQLAFEKKSKL